MSGSEEHKESRGVREAIEAFTQCPKLCGLAEGDWPMFGKSRPAQPETPAALLLASAGLSHTEARRLVGSGAVRKTHLDQRHFVLTNKRGDRLFGLFRAEAL